MAATYTFEDLSGAGPSESDNPYDGLIEACENDSSKIQARYNTHRTTRAVQQKEKLASPDFSGVVIDPILKRLETEPGFEDPRHCLVFWARPPQKVKDLIAEIQRRLKVVAPKLWTMPPNSLHMTALEITHSLTSPEISSLVSTLRPSLSKITDYTHTHHPRLLKPTLSYDSQALALSYLPAASEPGSANDDGYTYHHLRRDLYSLATDTGVKVASRYVVPSAHLTVGRFIHAEEFEKDGSVDHEKMKLLVQTVDEINAWLEEEYWPKDDGIKDGGEWIVGEGKGLDCRAGALWYGSGGETIRLGKGF